MLICFPTYALFEPPQRYEFPFEWGTLTLREIPESEQRFRLIQRLVNVLMGLTCQGGKKGGK